MRKPRLLLIALILFVFVGMTHTAAALSANKEGCNAKFTEKAPVLKPVIQLLNKTARPLLMQRNPDLKIPELTGNDVLYVRAANLNGLYACIGVSAKTQSEIGDDATFTLGDEFPIYVNGRTQRITNAVEWYSGFPEQYEFIPFTLGHFATYTLAHMFLKSGGDSAAYAVEAQVLESWTNRNKRVSQQLRPQLEKVQQHIAEATLVASRE